MITPAYICTMAEYNADMNHLLYGAAARLSDAERRQPRVFLLVPTSSAGRSSGFS
jgi:uncharacterized damage-inducible protein DinB